MRFRCFEGGDCDDTDADVHPEADEICNDLDDDCEGAIELSDDDAIPTVYFADADQDGFGDPESTALGCGAPENFVEDGTDCDDDDNAVHPDASEVCDGVDNDCDLRTDAEDTDTEGVATTFTDIDGDGFGDPDTEALTCPGEADRISQGGDCADSDAAVNPDASEDGCTDIDEDCDPETTGVQRRIEHRMCLPHRQRSDSVAATSDRAGLRSTTLRSARAASEVSAPDDSRVQPVWRSRAQSNGRRMERVGCGVRRRVPRSASAARCRGDLQSDGPAAADRNRRIERPQHPRCRGDRSH